MKRLTTLLLILTAVQISSASAALQPTETLYSNKGYPYKLLIDRADSLNIIYTESKSGDVECSVKLFNKGLVWNSSTLSVNKAEFDKQPLASCLSRDNAKLWLAKTFD